MVGGSGTGGGLGGGVAGYGGGSSGAGGGTTNECSQCHGSDQSPAPPVDLQGNTDVTFPGVGAHQSHLGQALWHHQVTCEECW